MDVHYREWGSGDPVIALHPLALESSGFAGFGEVLGRRGFRTIAVDLPGFGRTPAPDEPLRPDVLARPVIALARSLEKPPIVLGVSLGGRVALECALTAPDAFREVIPIAPYLPWLRYRAFLYWMWLFDPAVADWMPFERIWPSLHRLSKALETMPYLREDELAQAGARFVYYLACPATRHAFFSAMRELALDPAEGPRGLWTRLPELAIPATFIWGLRDRLVTPRFAARVGQTMPSARRLLLPCAAHWFNGPHHRCVAELVARLVDPSLRTIDDDPTRCRARPVDPRDEAVAWNLADVVSRLVPGWGRAA